LCSAAAFHPACENAALQATHETDLFTAAGKLSHAAADAAVGTKLESERFARTTQDQTFLFGRDVPSPCVLPLSYPQPAQQTDCIECANPALHINKDLGAKVWLETCPP